MHRVALVVIAAVLVVAGSSSVATAPVLAGSSSVAAAAPLSWSERIPLGALDGGFERLNAVACPSVSQCTAVD